MDSHELFIMYFTLFVYTSILTWGLRLVSSSLRDSGKLIEVLREKDAEEVTSPDGTVTKKPASSSFSRLSGAVGSMGLAAAFIGIGYWVIMSLFSDGELTRLNDIGTYFLAGSALFAPYAFNQLSKVFK